MSKKNKSKNKKVKDKKVKHLEAEEMPSSDQVAHIVKLAKEKEEATKLNEPWVGIISMDVDYDKLNEGNFELDWNNLFLAKLIRAGYQGKEDHQIIDQWFVNVCRNVVLETFEQEQADTSKRKPETALRNDGRREYK